MGGRGSQFNERINAIDSLIKLLNEVKNLQNTPTSWLDVGDVKKEIELVVQNDLTKSLKKDNIISCESLNNLNRDVVNSNLSQIKTLTNKYSNISKEYLKDDVLKIRSFKMDNVSFKTGKRTPEYNILAVFQSETGQICLNARSMDEVEKIKKVKRLSILDKHSVKVDEKNYEVSTITHEYGHFVQDCIIEKHLKQDIHRYNTYKTNPQEREKIRLQEAIKITKDIANIAVTKFKATQEDLIQSEYSKTNHFEWFAETFTETNLHSEKKPITLAMKYYLEKENE